MKTTRIALAIAALFLVLTTVPAAFAADSGKTPIKTTLVAKPESDVAGVFYSDSQCEFQWVGFVPLWSDEASTALREIGRSICSDPLVHLYIETNLQKDDLLKIAVVVHRASQQPTFTVTPIIEGETFVQNGYGPENGLGYKLNLVFRNRGVLSKGTFFDALAEAIYTNKTLLTQTDAIFWADQEKKCRSITIGIVTQKNNGSLEVRSQ